MPIGKNSIKRVANNGYSSVKTSAPDMENSTVIANPSPEVIEKMIPSSKKIAPKKTAAAKKKPATKAAPKAAPKAKSAPLKTEEAVDNGCVRFGSPLPVHLL